MMLPDPRRFPFRATTSPRAQRLYGLAEASLGASTGEDAARIDATIAAEIDSMLRERGEALAELLDGAPSVAIYRHLSRRLAESAKTRRVGDLAIALFAIPVCIVAGVTTANEQPVLVDGVLRDVDALVALLQEHGALGGNRSFTLANVLVDARALDVPRLAELRSALDLDAPPLAFEPAAIEIRAGEAVHLRFLLGRAIGSANIDVLRDAGVGRWGLPLAQALNAQLRAPGASLVALPRAAMSLPAAVAIGRSAQRDISAQLFASNAIRTLRASFGEPVAVISAHAASEAPGGGELRVSLSSPLSPRDASGFRCPIHAGERVDDVLTMLVDLLRDCRMGDIRLLSGIHADRDAVTGGPLLFKPDTIPPQAQVHVH
jgi:hypothetical protein